jgi:CubicO group peptidase (beta-lactamase class C family)
MTTSSPALTKADLDAAVQAAMERWAVPGLALGVLQEGEAQAWGYGVASRETGTAVTPGTLFQVGSISKVFTATLVMQLVDEGTLDLDRPVAAYLPSLRLADEAATRSVTLRQLLSHTAGFYGDRFDDYGWGDDALARSVTEFHSLRQYSAPGELWAYCNTGFQLAGRVIEAVLGTTFEAAMRERIFTPLGLTRSFYFAHEAITYPVAVGHNTQPPPADERPQQPKVARAWGRSRCRSAQGGVLSTIEDLLRFAAFHMGDGTANGRRVVSAESLRVMQEPLVEAALAPHWGIGWSVEETDGVRLVGHGGTTNGFQARLALVPARRFAFAVLTNSNLGAAAHREIGAWLVERLGGVRQQEPSRVSLTPDALARLAGRYERPGITVTLTPAEDGLRLETQGKDPMTKDDMLIPPRHAVAVGERKFLVLDGETAGSTFDFILDGGGEVRFLRLSGRLLDRAT